MDIHERMMNALDMIKPDWFIVYANQQELADCTYNKLRRDVCERLFDILRAGVQADIVDYKLPTDTKILA